MSPTLTPFSPAADPFAEALRFTLAWEGGLADVPGDRGGRTFRGITQATWDDWRRENSLLLTDVATATASDVEALYRGWYWAKAAGAVAVQSPPLAVIVFDAAVHHGAAQSTRWLQRAVGAAADGVCGPQTAGRLAARLSATPWTTVADDLLSRRRQLLEELAQRPRQGQFLKGWLRRVDALSTFVGAP